MSVAYQIGPHRVAQACITTPMLESMLSGRTVDVLYCDPPWGDAAAGYFRTLNRKMTGADSAPVPAGVILDRIFELINRFVKGHVFIEYGRRWRSAMEARFSSLHNAQVFESFYRAGNKILPCLTFYGCTLPTGNFHPEVREDLIGYGQVCRAVESVAVPGGLLLDPCCGMGFSARAAIDNGMVFYGSELNAKRLDKTIALLMMAQSV